MACLPALTPHAGQVSLSRGRGLNSYYFSAAGRDVSAPRAEVLLVKVDLDAEAPAFTYPILTTNLTGYANQFRGRFMS